MSHRLPPPLALTVSLLTAGCATTPTAPSVEICPPAPPAVECPAFPARATTLRGLLTAWETAQAAHAACSAALDAWREAHRGCRPGR